MKKSFLKSGLAAVLVLAVLLIPKEAKADATYPDDNGNGIPNWVETAMNSYCAGGGPRTVWAMWAAPYYMDPPAGTTSKRMYMLGALKVCANAGYSGITNARFYNLSSGRITFDSSSFSIPNTSRGNFSSVAGTGATINLVGLPTGCSNVNVNYSVEALHGGTWDRNSGTLGVQICFQPQQYSNYGGNYYNNYPGNYYNNYPGNYYNNYSGNYYNNPPPPPPPDPHVYITDSGQAPGSTVYPGGTLYYEASYDNTGGTAVPGPTYPEGFSFSNGSSPDSNSSIPAGGAWETNPDATCADVNSGSTAHGTPQHAYYCVGSIPAGTSRGGNFFRVDVSPTAAIGSQVCVHADLNMPNNGGSIHSGDICHTVVRAPFNIDASIGTCAPTPSPGGQITPGTNYCMTANAGNTQAGASDEVVLQIKEDPPAGQPTVSTPGSPTDTSTGNWDSSDYNNYCGPENTPACGANNYHFNDDQIPGNQNRTGNFYFNIPTNAPDGVQLCFQGYYYYKNIAHTPLVNLTNRPCWEVINPRYPFVTTENGDVHAGGGLFARIDCQGIAPAGAGTNKFVRGGSLRPGDSVQSQAEFMLSASGTISNFGSAASLGGGGFYGRICRPDLQQSLVRSQATRIPCPPTPALCTVIPPPLLGRDYIYEATGPDVKVFLPLGQTILPGKRATVYATGDVYIQSDVTYSTILKASTANDLPAFGVIAGGGIFIDPSVQRLDGYYYAGENGEIDTCRNYPKFPATPVIGAGGTAGGNNPSSSPCSRELTVNGFFMANTIKFRRTGPGTIFGPVRTERLVFTGDLYIAPPPGFVDNFTVRATRPSLEGEKPPLY